MSIFKIENLTYYYPEAKYAALQEVNLQVQAGEFLLLTGGSGCGKSSLARALAGLIPDFYGGRIGGRVIYQEQDIRNIKARDLARNIGMVFQDPERQLVMTSVEAEIAFGLENLGLSQSEMLRRIAEVMSFFDLTALQGESTSKLSGGQKQKLALASVMAMQPQVLILDEPTSQMDPLAVEEILNLVKRLNEELNITIILIEQRLERCFHLADRVAVLEAGRIVKLGTPAETAAWEVQNHFPFVPIAAGFFARIAAPDVPLTIKAGRRLLQDHYLQQPGDTMPVPLTPTPLSMTRPERMPDRMQPDHPNATQTSGPRMQVFKSRWGISRRKPSQDDGLEQDAGSLVEINKLWFTYPNGREALRSIDLSVTAGEFLAIIGENGSGKTTLLKQLSGIIKPGRGKVKLAGMDTTRSSPQEIARMVGYLSQNPDDHLFHDTVEEELRFTQTNLGKINPAIITQLLDKLDLAQHRQKNPRDLSSGERQRVALASVLASNPRLLLLDEPTRGIDYGLKAKLGSLLQALVKNRVTVILVTHDIDFAAEYAARMVMMFDGIISADGSKQEVLGQSMFYTPQIRKLFSGIDDQVFTMQEAVEWTDYHNRPNAIVK